MPSYYVVRLDGQRASSLNFDYKCIKQPSSISYNVEFFDQMEHFDSINIKSPDSRISPIQNSAIRYLESCFFDLRFVDQNFSILRMYHSSIDHKQYYSVIRRTNDQQKRANRYEVQHSKHKTSQDTWSIYQP